MPTGSELPKDLWMAMASLGITNSFQYNMAAKMLSFANIDIIFRILSA